MTKHLVDFVIIEVTPEGKDGVKVTLQGTEAASIVNGQGEACVLTFTLGTSVDFSHKTIGPGDTSERPNVVASGSVTSRFVLRIDPDALREQGTMIMGGDSDA